MKSINLKVLVLSFILIALMVAVFFGLLPGKGSIDHCLDLGGAWDYENKKCTLSAE